MKFSFRYTLAVLIFFGLIGFLGHQTLQNSASNLTFGQKLLQEINPFWKSPDTAENIFSQEIPISIQNSHHSDILVSGKIRIFDENNNPLTNIAENREWSLADYFLLNPSGEMIEPNQNKTFSVQWKGFGHKIALSGTPTIIWQTPSQFYHDNDEYTLSFWEKYSLQEKIRHFTAQTEIIAIDNSSGENISLPQENHNFNISYPIAVAGINTGLILNIGLILIILLVFSKIISSWNSSNHRENINKFETEAKQLLENLPAPKYKKIKKIPRKNTQSKPKNPLS